MRFFNGAAAKAATGIQDTQSNLYKNNKRKIAATVVTAAANGWTIAKNSIDSYRSGTILIHYIPVCMKNEQYECADSYFDM